MGTHASSIKLTQCACAILWCLLSAGIIFGFAALKPILLSEGVYNDSCPTVDVCIEQDLKLNKVFTISAVSTNATALLVGFILDHYGPRVCGFIGAGFLTLGALTISNSLNFLQVFFRFDQFLYGYIFLAIGGPFVFISSFQLANSFPKFSGMILALLTGAFDTSSAVFLLYRLVYQNYSKISLQQFFNWYLIVPIFITVCQLFIMPNESYKTLGTVQKLVIEGLDENGQLIPGDDGSQIIPDANERESLLSANNRDQLDHESFGFQGRRKSVYEEYVEESLIQKSGDLFGVLDGYSVLSQLKSPFFLLMCGFCTVQMIRINYFVATIKTQETYLLGDELSKILNDIFDIALPLGGVIAIPFIGLLLDNFKTITILIILFIISNIIGICGVISKFYPNLIGILLLVIYRPFYYTAVSDYSAKVFGFETFGTVYGLMMFISGLINYFQIYLDLLTKTIFKGNPNPINYILIGTTFISGGSLIFFIVSQTKKIKRIDLEIEAENSQEFEIPQ
ncbi:hypothetical protein WICMUC_005130 [Wickerhamomyces mucosus]|uniref:Protein FMP42 n=1 Tax=Wickerhamomyces mucosus TaxID=1378264 RepID=A0A9P8PAS0_9ASCO|nr:hypothetical protein WICMUC_005130 [Wickerhamomyces mucosus]